MNNTAYLQQLFERLLEVPISSFERIGGGRNSQVYHLDCDDGRNLAAKVYYSHKEDTRDRQGTEFGGLSFLWKNGIRQIPEPILCDRDNGFSLYQFVHGTRADIRDISDNDIQQASEFLVQLEGLKYKPGANQLNPASEACFTLDAMTAVLERRFIRLQSIPEDGVLVPEMLLLLGGRIKDFFEYIKVWSRHCIEVKGGRTDELLPVEQRTLSPSDFGYHNAIRCEEGRLIFLDFEYFGWDDPAKMISDFVLHPGMEITFELKTQFVQSLLNHFGHSGALPNRLLAVYPLFALKWCMILLNEFVPADLARRDFAATQSIEIERRRVEQLAKVNRMLDEVESNYERDWLFA